MSSTADTNYSSSGGTFQTSQTTITRMSAASPIHPTSAESEGTAREYHPRPNDDASRVIAAFSILQRHLNNPSLLDPSKDLSKLSKSTMGSFYNDTNRISAALSRASSSYNPSETATATAHTYSASTALSKLSEAMSRVAESKDKTDFTSCMSAVEDYRRAYKPGKFAQSSRGGTSAARTSGAGTSAKSRSTRRRRCSVISKL